MPPHIARSPLIVTDNSNMAHNDSAGTNASSAQSIDEEQQIALVSRNDATETIAAGGVTAGGSGVPAARRKKRAGSANARLSANQVSEVIRVDGGFCNAVRHAVLPWEAFDQYRTDYN